MIFKKKIKSIPENVLVKGVFKRRKWPWITAIIGAVLTLIPLAIAALGWMAQQMALLNTLVALGIACLLGSLLGVILLCPKRTLIVTNDRFTFQKGKNMIVDVELDGIEMIDVALLAGIVVSIPDKKIKILQLCNRKEVYDKIILKLNAPVAAPAQAPDLTLKEQNDQPSTPAPQSTSTPAEKKILYFLNLLSVGAITEEQFKLYAEQILKCQKPE